MQAWNLVKTQHVFLQIQEWAGTDCVSGSEGSTIPSTTSPTTSKPCIVSLCQGPLYSEKEEEKQSVWSKYYELPNQLKNSQDDEGEGALTRRILRPNNAQALDGPLWDRQRCV